jgi:hypothetical protein
MTCFQGGWVIALLVCLNLSACDITTELTKLNESVKASHRASFSAVEKRRLEELNTALAVMKVAR